MIEITHNAGFFSCCSVRLHEIIGFFNKHNKLSTIVDTSQSYKMYKKDNTDVTYDFFKNYNEIVEDIQYINRVDFNHSYQFSNYKNLDYKNICPFIKKYFTPSNLIIDIRNRLVEKYNINTKKFIGIYYRGTDKLLETKLGPYAEYVDNLKKIYKHDCQILIQSDSAPFLDYINDNCKNMNIITIQENKVSYTQKGIHYQNNSITNYEDIKYLIATFLIISECENIICSSGSGSIWIMLYRGNGDNIQQFLNDEWL